MFVSISSNLDFCVCEYVDVELLFEETSANSLLGNVVFSTYKCKIV